MGSFPFHPPTTQASGWPANVGPQTAHAESTACGAHAWRAGGSGSLKQGFTLSPHKAKKGNQKKVSLGTFKENSRPYIFLGGRVSYRINVIKKIKAHTPWVARCTSHIPPPKNHISPLPPCAAETPIFNDKSHSQEAAHLLFKACITACFARRWPERSTRVRSIHWETTLPLSSHLSWKWETTIF